MSEAAHTYGLLLGIADEYGTIWQGEPGASERIGDLVQRGDSETFEVRLTTRSAERYERDIRSLEARLLAQELTELKARFLMADAPNVRNVNPDKSDKAAVALPSGEKKPQ